MKHLRLGLVLSLVGAVLSVFFASGASAAAAWQLTVTRIDPSPQLSGTTIRYRVQAQCSAVDEAECRDSEIRWPAQAPSTFTIPALHPAIESFSTDPGSGEWVVNLQDSIAAGSSLEFDVVASSPNHTTPNGTAVSVIATISSSNTPSVSATATGAWSASANLGIEKYLAFGPDTDALLDQPVRYYIYPCDPSWVSESQPGHLYVEGVNIVDTLPAGVVMNSASPGGVFNAGANTVTWNVAGILENRSCTFAGASDYWVEVTFPSTVFGPTSGPPALIEATNTVDISGYPVGRISEPAARMTDSDSLLHGFSLPNPVGTHTKYAWTPYFGLQNLTYENDRADFSIDIRTSAAGTSPYFFRIDDPMPCLDYTPNAATQYESHDLGGPVCSIPAFQPDRSVDIEFNPNFLNIASTPGFVASHPTVPLRVRSTTGASVIVDVPYEQTTLFGQLKYSITGAALVAALGGAGASDISFDSRDIGLQVKVTPSNGSTATRLRLVGNVAPDTPAHPLLDQYRVRNYGHFTMYVGAEERYIGSIQDSVTIVNRGPVLGITKSADPSFGYVSLDVSSYGSSLRSGEKLIVTDLLPVGYQFESLSQTFLGYGTGNWYWAPGTGYGTGSSNSTGYPALNIDVRSHLSVEAIDDYSGTGRQLVRVSFDEPPTADGWRGVAPGSSSRVSFKVTPNPMTLAATNQAQVFVSDSVSSSLLQCQTGVFGSPTAASSSDPNDLDADGLTSGDAFCQGFTSIVPTSTVVNVAANKAVKGDLDPGFRKFPAIGAITSAGGAGKFQLNLTNVGGVALRDLVIYDILPFVGDTGLSQTQLATPRGSDWATTFVGLDPTTVPAGAVVEYSASTNPCRNELTTPAGAFPAGCVNDWSTMLPSGSASLVRALRVTFPAGTLSTFDPTEQIAIEYDVTYPAGVTPGTVAWNNFAYAATRTDTGTAILPAEPPKVGLAIPQVDLALTKAVAPATVLVGQPVTYTVTIDHQGSVSPSGVYTLPASVARNVELRDDLGGGALTVVGASSLIINERTGSSDGATFDESTGAILIPELGPNDKYVLTYQARRSTSGATTNLAEVLDHPGVTDIDSTPGNGVPTEDDIATATAQWVAPSIDLQKQVESSSGSGSFIEADASDGLAGRYQRYQPVRYRFVVTNTSAIPLTGVTLTDSVIWFACDRSIGNMAPGQIVTIDCTWPFGFASGRVVNTATVNGVATVSGATSTVSDTDLATVEIQAPIDLSLTKRVDVSGNGNWVSSASVSLGSTFKYQLTVSNSPTAGEATGVVVREELPAGVTVVSGPAEFDLATSQWSVGTLAAGASKSIELVARIADLAQFRAGTGINRAQVSAANEPDIDSVPGNGVTTEDDIDHADITVNVHAIGNQVFEDLDANGVRDSNEVGIAGVTMELLNSSGVVIASSTTDSGGMYLFDDLPSGRYRVRVAAAEFLAGGTLQGWKSDLVEEALADSDIDNNDNGLAVLGEIVSGEITLDSSEPTNESPTSVSIAADSYSNLTVDFGFYRLGSIGDFVWLDTNADGVQQSTETGIAGVRVVLLDAAGATIASAETGSDGRYLFSDLAPGSYQVKFDLTSLPIELRATVDNTSDDAADSDANPLTGLTALVRLAGGQDIRTVDLGATKAVHELVLTKVALGNAVAGQNVDWKIVLKNNGPDPARGAITLTDALPAELSFVSAASQTDGLSCDYATATRTVSCVTANGLGSGKELVALVTTTVSPSAGASIVNSASVATQTQTQIAPASEKVDVRGASLSNPAVPVPSTPARESTAAGSLVLTGANSTLWAGLAVVLLCLGCVFAALSRRREPKH